MEERLKSLYQLLAKKNLEGLLVSKRENIFYLTGFTGEDSLLLMLLNNEILFTDARFQEQAETEIPDGIKLRIVKRGLLNVLAAYIRRRGLKRIGFEEEWLTCLQYRRLKDKANRMRLLPTQGVVEYLRRIKSPDEIGLIREAVRIAASSMDKIKKILKPGLTEIEIATELEKFIKVSGAEGCAFAPIVASGKRTSLPHARPTQRRIREGEVVLVDAGAVLRGYNSDLTRMLPVGKIDKAIKEKIEIVKRAQKEAISQISPGVKASFIDGVARNVFKRAGLDRYFLHALGHGVGVEVHENPSICSRNSLPLEEGMVFTVEPAIYIPGWGGVRLEKMVRVAQDGCEVITG